MTAPSACPGCGAKLPPHAEACPNCPASFPEREARPAPLVDPKVTAWAVPLLILAGFGAAIWGVGNGLFRLASDEGRPVAGSSEGASAPAASPAPAPPSPAPAAAKAPAEEESPGIVSVLPAGRNLTAPSGEWRIRGAVYDLATLAPIPGCRVELRDPGTGASAEVPCGPDGRYRAVLPAVPGRGYLASPRKAGYSRDALRLRPEEVRGLPADLRGKLVRELRAARREPAALRPRGDAPLVADFYLAPLGE